MAWENRTRSSTPHEHRGDFHRKTLAYIGSSTTIPEEDPHRATRAPPLDARITSVHSTPFGNVSRGGGWRLALPLPSLSSVPTPSLAQSLRIGHPPPTRFRSRKHHARARQVRAREPLEEEEGVQGILGSKGGRPEEDGGRKRTDGREPPPVLGRGGDVRCRADRWMSRRRGVAMRRLYSKGVILGYKRCACDREGECDERTRSKTLADGAWERELRCRPGQFLAHRMDRS